MNRCDLQAINFFRFFGSEDVNNYSSCLNFSLFAIIVEIIYVHLLSLSHGDVFQGLRIGVEAAERLVQDAEVFDYGVCCFELLRGEGLRRLRPRGRRCGRRLGCGGSWRLLWGGPPGFRIAAPRTGLLPTARRKQQNRGNSNCDGSFDAMFHCSTPPLVSQTRQVSPTRDHTTLEPTSGPCGPLRRF